MNDHEKGYLYGVAEQTVAWVTSANKVSEDERESLILGPILVL